jgi:Uri superfamily endonuclease
MSHRRCEHAWAQILQHAPGAGLPIKGFGSSDCACPAHLFRFESTPEVHLPGAVRIAALLK